MNVVDEAISETLKTMGFLFRAARLLARRPDRVNAWDKDASHWQVKIERFGKTSSMVITYSMGSAHKLPPNVAGVMHCLVSDSQYVMDGTTFEQWAGDLGYDVDSISALRTFEACQKQARDFAALLEPGDMDRLVDLFRDY
jgi:hypothetical protein